VDQGYGGGGDFSNPVANPPIVSDPAYDNYSSQHASADYDQGDNEAQKFTLSLNVSVNKSGVIALIFTASVIVLISAARACAGMDHCPYGDSSVNYAIAVGVISMAISGIHMLATYYQPGLAAQYASFVSIFLLLWWGLGAAIMTFHEPFPGVGNGYFASWLGFIMSGSFASQTVNFIGSRTGGIRAASLDRAIVFFILLASGVEIVAASVLCDDSDCTNEYAFAVASGVVSACICLIYLLAGGALPINMAAGFFGVWWLISTGVLTFDSGDVFGDVGNGYFAVWSCFFASVYFCYYVFVGGMAPST